MRLYYSFGFDEMSDGSHLKGPLSYLGQVPVVLVSGVESRQAACKHARRVLSDEKVTPSTLLPSSPWLIRRCKDLLNCHARAVR